MKKSKLNRFQTSSHNKMSLPEFLLFILMLLCFPVSIYALFLNNHSMTLLLFTLHGCCGLLFFLLSMNRMSLEQAPESELSYGKNLQRKLLSEKAEEADRLRRQCNKYKKRNDLLEDELQKLKDDNHALQAALLEAENLSHKTEDAIALSQLLPAYGEEQPISLDLIAAIRLVMEEMQPFTQKAGIQMQLSTSSETLMIYADPEYMRILLRNVIDNSVKYMQQSGQLVITASGIGSDLFLVLKDNGNGLSTEETKHIFELNYQGSNRVSGNGLGLTQAKAIVDYYGGTIYARSSSGAGMAIYIQLPSSGAVRTPEEQDVNSTEETR